LSRKTTTIRIIGLLAFGLCGLYLAFTIEGYKPLGHGYFLLRRARWISNGFESIYHSKELYFRWKNLGQTGQGFISPSGKHAVYEHEGKLILFGVKRGTNRDITDGQFGVPETVNWHEPERYIVVTYYEDQNHRPSTIHIPD
jgi:hypothetical protein